MRKFISVMSALLILTSAYTRQQTSGQSISNASFLDTLPSNTIHSDTTIVFTKAEKEPNFEGDDKAWRNFWVKNMNPVVPVDNGAPVGEYTVIIRFIVETDGTLTDVKALTKHGYGLEEECVRIIKLSGKWQPAMQNGRVVRFYKKQPFTFVVSES
ncbi:MAG: energy transducer TonB [Chitinophagaceae bacterium]